MKRIIWSYELNLEEEYVKERIQELKDEYDYTDEQILNMVYEENQTDLEWLRDELNIVLENEIIAIADLGLWDGIHKGYKIVGYNVSDCLYSEYEPIWYIDKYGNFRSKEYHHDGVNHILYREFKDISDQQKENFIQKIYYGKVTDKDISRYTRKIGDKILNL